MNEVEKMYENAGIKKINTQYANNISYHLVKYPPFTAEKQLELIKWCLDNYRGYIFESIETEWFEEQLCAFINNIWQDLTDTEKAEIKNILESEVRE